MSLNTMKVLVTGAGSGIGAAIALTLAEAGARVAINDIEESRLQETASRIASVGADSTLAAGDVSTPEGAAKVVRTAESGLAGLTGLVNNVGAARGGPMASITEAEWAGAMQVNFSSAFHTAQAAFPMLKGGGAIVNVSSLCAFFPVAGAGPYNVAKAAVNTLTQQLALEWGTHGIRVNAVAPGLISGTNFSASSKDEAVGNRRKIAVPLERNGTAGDIAPVVKFLLSEDAGYITGQILTVDGGLGINLQALIPS